MQDVPSWQEVEADDRYKKLDSESQKQVKARWGEQVKANAFPSLHEVRTDKRYLDSSPEQQAEIEAKHLVEKQRSYKPTGTMLEGFDFGGGFKDSLRVAHDAMQSTVASVAAMYPGKNPRRKPQIIQSVRQNWKDQQDFRRLQNLQENEYPNAKVFPAIPYVLPEGIQRKDIQAFGTNLGYSGAAMLAAHTVGKVTGAAGGALGTSTMGPGVGTAVGTAIGTAVGQMGSSYLAGSAMDKTTITEELLNSYEDSTGYKLTPAEADSLIELHQEDIDDHGFWEGVTEAAQTPTNILLMKATAGAMKKKFSPEVAVALLTRLIGNQVIETGGETITQLQQQQAESRMGLTGEPERQIDNVDDWIKSYEEVVAQTLLTSGTMAAVGAGAGAAKRMASGEPTAEEQKAAANSIRLQNKSRMIQTLRENSTKEELEHMAQDSATLAEYGLTPHDLTAIVKTDEYTQAEIDAYEAQLASAPSDAVRQGIMASSLGQAMEANRKILLPTQRARDEAKAQKEVDEAIAETEAEQIDIPIEHEAVEPTEEPTEEVPIPTEEPVAEEPVAEEPVAEEPVAEEPVAEEPVAEEPVAEEPVAEEPVKEEPVMEEMKDGTDTKPRDTQEPTTQVEERDDTSETVQTETETVPAGPTEEVAELQTFRNIIEQHNADIEGLLADTSVGPQGKTIRAGKVAKDIPPQKIRYVRAAHNVPMDKRSNESLLYELSLLNDPEIQSRLNENTSTSGSVLDKGPNKQVLNPTARMSLVISELTKRGVTPEVNSEVYDMEQHGDNLERAQRALEPREIVQPTKPKDALKHAQVETAATNILKTLKDYQRPGKTEKAKKSILDFAGDSIRETKKRIEGIPLEERTERMLEAQIRIGEIFPSEELVDTPFMTAGFEVFQRYQAVKGHKSEKPKSAPIEKPEPKQVVEEPKQEKPAPKAKDTEKQVDTKPKSEKPKAKKKKRTKAEQTLINAKSLVTRRKNRLEKLKKTGTKKQISDAKTSLAIAESALNKLTKPKATKPKTADTKSKKKTSTDTQKKKEPKLDKDKSPNKKKANTISAVSLKRINELRTQVAMTMTDEEAANVIQSISLEEAILIWAKIDSLTPDIAGDYKDFKDKLTEVFDLDPYSGLPKDFKTAITERVENPLSVDEVRSGLVELFGKKVFNTVNVIESSADLDKFKLGVQPLVHNGQFAGFYAGGKIYIFADAVASQEFLHGLMIHEGGHLLLANSPRFKPIYERFLKRMQEIGKGAGSLPEQRAVQRAMRKAMSAPGSHFTLQEEALMYYLQDGANSDQKWYRQIMSYIRQALFKFGFNNLTANDMAQITARYIRGSIESSQAEVDQRIFELDEASRKDVRYSWIGDNAEHPVDNWTSQSRAIEMFMHGETLEHIFESTGWFRTADRWIYEITDDTAKLNEHFQGRYAGGRTYKLSDLIDHPELFKLYPFLTDMPVDIEHRYEGGLSDGTYYPAHKRISIMNDLKDPLDVLLHEIQHAIQHKEGFPSGGSTSEGLAYAGEASMDIIENVNTRAIESYEKRIKENEVGQKSLREHLYKVSAMTHEEIAEMDELNDIYEELRLYHQDDNHQEVKDAWNAIGDSLSAHDLYYESWYGYSWAGYRKSLEDKIKGASEDSSKLKDILKDLKAPVKSSEHYERDSRWNAGTYNKFALYQALHGEVMARDAQMRRNLTAEERRAQLPGIKGIEDRVIETYNHGPSYSEQERTDEAFDKSPKEMIQDVLGTDKQMSNPKFAAAIFRDNIQQAAKNSDNPVLKKLAADMEKYDPVFKRTKSTQVTNWFDRIFSSPEYYSQKDDAAKKVVEHALLEDETKFIIQDIILGVFADFAKDLTKSNPEAVAEASKYIVETDQTGIGFHVKHEDGLWVVYDPEGKRLEDWDEREHATDYWIEQESLYLKEDHPKRNLKALSYDARLYVAAVRGVLSRSLMEQNKDLENQIKHHRNAGLEEPVSGTTPLSEIIRGSGDLEGTYFPRVRGKGKYYAKLIKPGEPNYVLTFDDFLPENEMRGDLSNRVKRFINKKTPTGKRIAELQAEGYTLTELDVTKALAAEVYDPTGIPKALDALLDAATESVEDGAYKLQLMQLNNLIVKAIGNIYKEKSNLSNRRQRSQDLSLGYEMDVTKAVIAHAQQVAAGIAKRTTAQNMVNAFTGHDLSFEDYMKDNPDSDYSGYRTELKKNKISPSRQKPLFQDMTTYMNYVLKPVNPMNRAVGYLKALAVVKYLGFRPASALVNMTNMFMGVPATLVAHTGIGGTAAYKYVADAASKYAAYRSSILALRGVAPGIIAETRFQIERAAKATAGALTAPVELTNEEQKIFDAIHKRGWDSPHFNIEAVRAIQGTMPKMFNTLMETSMYMFGATEKANRAMTIFAAYKAHQANPKNVGLTRDQLLQLAKHTSDRAHGIYGKGAKPWVIQKVPMLDLMYTFMKFQHNYLMNGVEAGMKYKNWKAMAMLWLSPAVTSGISVTFGFKAAMIVTGAIMSALGYSDDDPEEAIYKWTKKHLGKFAGKFARHGTAGSVLGLNLKGSLSFNSPLGTGKLTDLGGAPISTIQDGVEAYRHFKYGETLKGLEKALPAGAGGALAKAYRLRTEGYTTTTSSPKFFGSEQVQATNWEAIVTAMTFNPQRLAAIQEELWHDRLVKESYTKERGQIMRRLRNYEATPDHKRKEETFNDIIKRIDEYNQRVDLADPKYNVTYLTWPKIIKNLQQSMRPSKQERMREINE